MCNMTKRSIVKILIVAAACLVMSASFVFAEPGSGGVNEAGPRDLAPGETIDYDIPVVYIDIDETGENPSVEDMNTSPDHSVSCVGTMRIDAPDGFRYSDMPDTEITDTGDLAMSIRGRGNSTWSRYPKRPYKIKLDSKADLFGLGKNKHWVLVANYYDHTLVKDRITAWLGDKMDFEFTPMGVPVDVVMTGSKYGEKYLGSYYFSENVRVGENRLEIEELKETDVDPDTITGGYLIQNSLQVRQGSPDRFITKHGVGWATHTPTFDTEADGHALTEDQGDESEPVDEEKFNDPDPVGAGENVQGDAYENHVQQDYIQDYIQQVEDALFEGGKGYREKMDLESAAKYYLVQEFSINRDSFGTGSTYIYKKRNNDKIYWGPLWDFDFAWYYDDTYEGYNIKHEWLEPMFCDRTEGGFVQEVEKQWAVMRPALVDLAKDGGVLDGYMNETRESANADQAIWRPDEDDFSYDNEIAELKKWINNRISWTEDHIKDFENIMHRVTFMADGKVFENKFVMDKWPVEIPQEVPEKDGYFFMGWKDENGKTVDYSTVATGDMTVTADFVPDSQVTKAEDIAFQKTSDIQKRGFYVSGYTIRYTVIPEDAQDKRIKWTSSDESFATVDDNGVVTYVDKGTGLKSVTITAALKNGKKREFKLYLTDDSLPAPDSISPEQEHIEMTVGGQAACTIKTDPDPAVIDDYEYTSDDEKVVTVDPFDGVLTAVGPGQTKVHIKTMSPGEIERETSVTVTVKPEPVDIKGARVSGLKTKTYTGSAIKPRPVVKLDGKTLVSGKDYRLTYTSNRKVGTAKIIITGIGAYKGSKTAKFRIIPKGTKIKTIKGIKKGFRIKWAKKTAEVSGYQIKWSRKAGMSKAKSRLIKSKKRTALKVSKLKARKKYYVQVRTYKTVKGKKYWSGWSKKRAVKTAIRS